MKIRALLVEDNPVDAETLRISLSKPGGDWEFDVTVVDSLAGAREKLASERFGVILLDLMLPDSSGVATLQSLMKAQQEMEHDLPVIVITHIDDIKAAVEAVRAGAQDYLLKDSADLPNLPKSVAFAMERKSIQNRLAKALQEAQNATRLKDQFVSLVAHDLRSPFTSILVYLRLMQSDENPRLDAKHSQIIDRVISASESMVQMIDDLLDVSRLKTGQLQPRRRFFDATEIVARVLEDNRRLAEEKGIALASALAQETRIFADPALFRQVIHNLVVNAIKFSYEGSDVTVFSPAGQPSTVAVKDTGKGIGPGLLPDIFRHEVKTSTPGTKGERGTGLGLPYCHDIMKAHGGSLTVESREGEGSVFYAALPDIRPRILVVDDDPMALEVMAGAIETLDVDIAMAESGEQAMEAVRQKTPDLILIDVNMPGTDGFGLLKAIKSERRTADIPVIMVTAGADVKIRDRAFSLGAMDFLAKPVRREDAIPRVRRAIFFAPQ